MSNELLNNSSPFEEGVAVGSDPTKQSLFHRVATVDDPSVEGLDAPFPSFIFTDIGSWLHTGVGIYDWINLNDLEGLVSQGTPTKVYRHAVLEDVLPNVWTILLDITGAVGDLLKLSFNQTAAAVIKYRVTIDSNIPEEVTIASIKLFYGNSVMDRYITGHFRTSAKVEVWASKTGTDWMLDYNDWIVE